MIYIFTIIFSVSFLLSFLNDKRKLLNGFLFLLVLGFAFLSLIQLSYDNNLVGLHSIFLGILYGLIPFLIAIMAIFFIINGFITLKRESRSLANSLSIFLGLGILFYYLISLLYFKFGFGIEVNHGLWGKFVFYSYLLTSFFFVIFIFIFFSFLTYSILYLNIPKDKNYDYIIIHGSGLIDGENVSPLLASRIDKAIDAFNVAKKSDVKFIASGGKGPDEKISEARAISNYLRQKGFTEENIILEEKSTTTYENLKYSNDLVKNRKENPQFLIVSNNYHVLRTSFYAKKLKMHGEGLGSKTAGYYIPSAFIREYIAILNKIRTALVILSVIFILFLYITR